MKEFSIAKAKAASILEKLARLTNTTASVGTMTLITSTGAKTQ